MRNYWYEVKSSWHRMVHHGGHHGVMALFLSITHGNASMGEELGDKYKTPSYNIVIKHVDKRVTGKDCTTG